MRKPLWLGLLVVVGCNSPGAQFVGTWKGQQPMPGSPAHIADTAGRVELELKSDGTFTFMRLSLPITGSWSSDGRTIRLVPKTAANQPMTDNKPVTLVPQPDGKLELSDDFSFGKNKVVLSRTQPAR